MESTKVEGGKYTVMLRKDSINHLVCYPHARVEPADARAALAAVLDLASGNETRCWSI